MGALADNHREGVDNAWKDFYGHAKACPACSVATDSPQGYRVLWYLPCLEGRHKAAELVEQRHALQMALLQGEECDDLAAHL